MKKRVTLLIIQIMVVMLTLVLAISTYAWFTSQTTVTVSETSITAAAGSNAAINSESSEPCGSYSGQTAQGKPGLTSVNGITEDDVPYTASKTVEVSFYPTDDNSVLTMAITSIVITRGASVVAESSPDIVAAFTWRAAIVIDGNSVTFKPDGNGFAVRADNNEYLPILPDSDPLTIVFTIIFQSEAEYADWLAIDVSDTEEARAAIDEIKPFAYSGYENMGVSFNCTFEVGMDTKPADIESQTPDEEEEPEVEENADD